MATESLPDLFRRWRLDQLLLAYPALRLVPTTGNSVVLAGTLPIDAQFPGSTHIVDEFEIELSVPRRFPKQIPSVRETGGRIPRSYHKLSDGALCLGTPTQLLMVLTQSTSILRFVERCLVPYLYRYSHVEKQGVAPYGELDHGMAGVVQDLMLLFKTDRKDTIEQFLRLTSMRKRHANKKPCPCGSGRRLGRCHNRRVNMLRDRLGRRWFRID
jgi:hypothetical protein